MCFRHFTPPKGRPRPGGLVFLPHVDPVKPRTPKDVDMTASFGDWKIPTRFAITPTGGSCAPGCHRRVLYDREKPVSYETEKK